MNHFSSNFVQVGHVSSNLVQVGHASSNLIQVGHVSSNLVQNGHDSSNSILFSKLYGQLQIGEQLNLIGFLTSYGRKEDSDEYYKRCRHIR